MKRRVIENKVFDDLELIKDKHGRYHMVDTLFEVVDLWQEDMLEKKDYVEFLDYIGVGSKTPYLYTCGWIEA